MAKAKTMNRSRNQLATTYAPESFFTFEGGIGACIARSAYGEPVNLAEPTLDQIFERMNELGRAWFDAAMKARDETAGPPVLPEQCVDHRLLNPLRSDFLLPGQDRIYLCRPSKMEYSPAPLAFRCRRCKSFRDYDTLRELDEDLANLSKTKCKDPTNEGPCDWEQLDVVFVHWSGNWEAPFPGQWRWNSKEQKAVKHRDTCVCGKQDFKLITDPPGVGDWFFECVCGKPLSPKWLQNDEESLRILGHLNLPDILSHVRMQATPYRASSTYYVKTDLFIDFKDSGTSLLARLRPGREEELKDFIATRYGFGSDAITDADVEAACDGKADCVKDLADYKAAAATISAGEAAMADLPEPARAPFKALLQQAYENKQRIVDDLRRRSILLPNISLPSILVSNLKNRQALFASKFDPFRLAIEHAALEQTRLTVEKRSDGKRPFVPFTRLDEDMSPEIPSEKAELEASARALQDRLGISEMGLIREFDLCKFSFGYSRMESTPVLADKRNTNMPVRLNLFPPVLHDGTSKTPVYVVQQGNEALYVRLKEEQVMSWLKALDCPDMFELSSEEKIGGGLLARAFPMNTFLDRLPESPTPHTYLYLYTLLHSFSHLVMKHVSEYSGLDLGSLGEYIFPADLAFVVYRNGTTMDLGNLSAMWRNAGTAMLASMLAPRSTLCGTGSLCTHRGGACPDCIMVPETSCIAGNKLLSRGVLRSIGGRPRIDTREGVISGYFDSALTS